MIDINKIEPGQLLLFSRCSKGPFRLVKAKRKQSAKDLENQYVSIYPTGSAVGIKVHAADLYELSNPDAITGVRLGPPLKTGLDPNQWGCTSYDPETGMPVDRPAEPAPVEPDDLAFVRTCEACPEQYDVFGPDGRQVAYVRLRWGGLSCRMPDHNGESVYGESIGDLGTFESDEQREEYLGRIARLVADRLNGDTND